MQSPKFRHLHTLKVDAKESSWLCLAGLIGRIDGRFVEAVADTFHLKAFTVPFHFAVKFLEQIREICVLLDEKHCKTAGTLVVHRIENGELLQSVTVRSNCDTV